MQTLITLLLGIGIGYYFAKDKYGPKIEPVVVDEHDLHRKQEEQHEKNLSWIMGHFNHNDEITNDRVEKLLGVSDATAERYLNELEKQGKLRQEGTTGRFVTYKKL